MDDPNSIYNLGYFIKKDIEMSPQENIISLGKYKKPPLNCVDEILKYTLQKLKSIDSNVDIIYYDLTRESLGIPVVRVVITNPIQMLASPLTIVSPRMYSFQKIWDIRMLNQGTKIFTWAFIRIKNKSDY